MATRPPIRPALPPRTGLVVPVVLALTAAATVGPSTVLAQVPPSAVGSAAAMQPGVFFPETFTLANGLQVVVVVNRRVPVVAHVVMYKVGAADEPRGKSGIAHYLEHLMFKGTESVAAGEFNRIVRREGGRDNAFTSWDFTGYFQTVAADRLRRMMELEADRMANLRLTDAVTRPELSVVREERRQTTDANPSRRLQEQARAVLFVHHPYGTPIIGWDHEIAGLTTRDALDFYESWYAPNNAVVLVSGDVDPAEVRRMAEETYGRVAARPVPARVRVEEPVLPAPRRIELADPAVREPAWSRSWLAPSYRAGATEHAYPLQVLSLIMGGELGRLYRKLVVEDQVATSAGMGYGAEAHDLSTLTVFASPAPGVAVETVEAALEAEIARLLADGVTETEIEDAKRRLRYAAVFARDSIMGPAMSLGTALASGLTVEQVEQWPVRIAAVTKAEVEAAARHVLARPGHVTSVLRPQTPAPQNRAEVGR